MFNINTTQFTPISSSTLIGVIFMIRFTPLPSANLLV